MYESFYHLSATPFRLTPDPAFCFSHSGYQEAYAYLQYAFELGEGLILLTGRPGAGKTTLVESFLRSLDVKRVAAARIATSDFEATDLLRAVAYDFDIDAAGLDKATLLRRIQQHFARRLDAGRRVLLVVDEAQRLSHDSLEELRLLADLQSGITPLLQIFLVGQETLRDLMGEPDMEQLQQRVIGTCRLAPLGLVETRAYVQHRLLRAGWRGDPELTGGAIRAVHAYSKGLPRHINKLCTRLLLQGYMEKCHCLDQEEVHRVARELGEEQLAPLAGDDTGASGGEGEIPDDLAVRAQPIDDSPPVVVRPAMPQLHRAGLVVQPGQRPVVRQAPKPEPERAQPRQALVYPGAPEPAAKVPAVFDPGLWRPSALVAWIASGERLTDRPALLFSLVAVLTLSAGLIATLLEARDSEQAVVGRMQIALYPLEAEVADVPMLTQQPELPAALAPGYPAPPAGEPAARRPEPVELARIPDNAGDTVPYEHPAPRPDSPLQQGDQSESVPDGEAAPQDDDAPRVVAAPEAPTSAAPVAGADVPRTPIPGAAAPETAREGADNNLRAADGVPADAAPAQSVPPETPRPGDNAPSVVAEPAPAAQIVAPVASVASGDTVPDSPDDTPVAPVASGDTLAELLAEAGEAFGEDRLLIPAGNSAHYYYRRVLARDPGNVEARRGIDRIVARYATLAGYAVDRGETKRAERYIARGLRIRPGDERLLAMRGNLRVVAAPPVVEPEPAVAPVEPPPPPSQFERPPEPRNFMQRLKAFFAASGAADPSSPDFTE